MKAKTENNIPDFHQLNDRIIAEPPKGPFIANEIIATDAEKSNKNSMEADFERLDNEFFAGGDTLES